MERINVSVDKEWWLVPEYDTNKNLKSILLKFVDNQFSGDFGELWCEQSDATLGHPTQIEVSRGKGAITPKIFSQCR